MEVDITNKAKKYPRIGLLSLIILAVAAGWQRVHHPQVAGAAAGGGTTQRYAWCLKNKENPCEVNPHRGIFLMAQ